MRWLYQSWTRPPFIPVSEVVTVDKWFRELQEPQFKVRPLVQEGWFVIDASQLTQPERTTPDKWIGYHPDILYKVKRAVDEGILIPDLFPRVPAADSWTGNFPDQIDRVKRPVGEGYSFIYPSPFVASPDSWTGYQPDFLNRLKKFTKTEFDFDVLPREAITPDKWLGHISLPSFKVKRAVDEGQTLNQPSPSGTAQIFNLVNDATLVFLKEIQYQAIALPLSVIETITVDKWFTQASEFQRNIKPNPISEFEIDPFLLTQPEATSVDRWAGHLSQPTQKVKRAIDEGQLVFHPLPFVPSPDSWDRFYPDRVDKIRQIVRFEFDFDPQPRPPDVENWQTPLQEPQRRLPQILWQEFDLDPLPRVAGPESWTGTFPDRINRVKPLTSEGLFLLYPLPFVASPDGWIGYQQETILRIKPLLAEGQSFLYSLPFVAGPEGWMPGLSEPQRKLAQILRFEFDLDVLPRPPLPDSWMPPINEPQRQKFRLVPEGAFSFDPSPRPAEVSFILVSYPDQIQRFKVQAQNGQQIFDPNPIAQPVTFWYPEFPNQFLIAKGVKESFIVLSPFVIGPEAPHVDAWMYPIEIPPRSLRPLLQYEYPDRDTQPPQVIGLQVYNLRTTSVGL